MGITEDGATVGTDISGTVDQVQFRTPQRFGPVYGHIFGLMAE
jgi:hypothetical protein